MKRRPSRSLLVVIAGSLLLAGCGPAGALLGVAPSGPQWSEYLPVRDGRTCILSSTFADKQLGFTAVSRQTMEFTNVHKMPDGIHFTLHNTIVTTTTGRNAVPAIRQVLILPYVFANDGSLRSAPPLSLGKELQVRITRQLIAPPLALMKPGKIFQSSTLVSFRFTNPSAEAFFRRGLTSGHGWALMRVTYQIQRLASQTIRTPAGVFRNALGIEETPKGIAVLNTSAKARHADSSMFQLMHQLMGSTIAWYARGAGIVETGTKGGFLAKLSVPAKLQKCTG